MDLLADLTEPQRMAVTHTEGPVLVLAAAGSGKTRVITRRVAYLIRQGVAPWNIAAITFTNKAAGEMRERVGKLLDERTAGRVAVGTFHALSARLLRQFADDAGVSPNFTIYDTADRRRVIKDAVAKLNLDSASYAAASVENSISAAKNKLVTPEDYARNARDIREREIARIYRVYQEMMGVNKGLDFDDLLMIPALTLTNNPAFRERLEEKFPYVLIDEYQDTNHAQYVFARLLTKTRRNLCVVGDPDQCLPPGARIRTPTGLRPVEEIREGDRVVTATGWGATDAMRVEKVMVSPFRGRLVRIRLNDGRVLRATPNHICFARLRPTPDLHYVYLMWKRGFGWRVGTTRGVRTSKDSEILSGLQVRTNQEVADAVWVVRVCANSSEARYFEHFYSVRYGLPSMVFFCRGRNMGIDQTLIDRLYREIDTEAGAARLMADLHLDRRYPHHRPGAVVRNGLARRHVLFTVFGDGRPHTLRPWHEHRIQLVTTGDGLKTRAAAAGLPVRNGVRGTWRVETSRKDYDEGHRLAREVCSLDGMEIVSRARLTPDKAFPFMPASHIHPGMAVPVEEDGRVVERIVESVEWEDYDGPVFDLSVPHTRNFVADGVVVHNSIYGWRGADINNILQFETDYPDAAVYRLEQNYRSTKTILAAADGLIRHNVKRKEKALVTANPAGEKAKVYRCDGEYQEADQIAHIIREEIDRRGRRPGDIAVFYRVNSLTRVLENAMRTAAVPYEIVRGVEFFNRQEIKDALSYLRVLANPADNLSLERIVNTPPRGIGETTMKRVATWAAGEGLPLMEGLRRARDAGAGRAAAKIDEFLDLLAKLAPRPGERVRPLLDRVIMTSRLWHHYAAEDTEETQRIANLNELLTAATEFDAAQPDGTLDDFLALASLTGDQDGYDPEAGKVTLMTLHAAKGLEFPIVLIAGLEEGLLPHQRAIESCDVEEERRLFFVGLSRALELLYISHSMYRAVRGESQRQMPSSFLEELPASAVEMIDLTYGADSDDAHADPGSDADESHAEAWEGDTDFGPPSGSRGAPGSGGAGGYGPSARRFPPRRTGPFRQRGGVAPRYGPMGGGPRFGSAPTPPRTPSVPPTSASPSSSPSAGPAPSASSSPPSRGSAPPANTGGYAVGMLVRHPSFGLGRITSIETGMTPRLRIKFNQVGEKTIIPGYVRLDIVGM